MKGQRKQSWSAAEMVPLILLSLVGLNALLVAPVRLPASTIVPQKTPRLTPVKPPPTNKLFLADRECGNWRAEQQTS